MTRRYLLLSSVAMLLLTPAAGAEELVANFTGSGNTTTPEFEVEGPWILDWRINSDYTNMLSFDVDLVDARTRMLQGVVLRRKVLGNGVRMFNQSGKFRFRVNGSFIRWQLKVIQLTPEEAKRYTPIGR